MIYNVRITLDERDYSRIKEILLHELSRTTNREYEAELRRIIQEMAKNIEYLEPSEK
jgi:hypothetical protein